MTARTITPDHAHRRAFTLVEMVIVIAILSTLLLAAVSLVRGTGPQARRAATDTIQAMLEQARGAAITNRTNVILAIAEPGDLPAGDDRCRIGLFKVDTWPETPNGTISATLISRWKILETGVVLIPGDVDGLPNPIGGTELDIEFGAKFTKITVHALAFNPRGRLLHPTGSSPVALRIAEGVYRNGTRVPARRAGSDEPMETRLKIGRISARSYRLDG